MRITDIIRGILDQVDRNVEQKAQQSAPVQVAVVEPEQPCTQCGATPCACSAEPDLLSIIQQLAGVPVTTEPNHVNAPNEQVAPIGASFPGGDDVHSRKNPADIRTDAPSMYPNFQAKQ